MREIEIKILNINVREITHKLRALRAKRVGKFFIVEKKFDFPDKRMKRRGHSLRLRTVGKRIELCHKERKRDKRFKIQEETETEVQDFAKTEKIFRKLGLIITRYNEKWRTSFVLDKIKVDIDKYPRIPAFIEIEGSKTGIIQTVRALGFSMAQTNTLTETKILKLYGINPRRLKF